MAATLQNPLGIHEQALLVRERRAELLAQNLANADTPGYKARDMDFRSALAAAEGQRGAGTLRTTQARHIAGGAGVDGAGGAEVLYRTPSQPSIDGNTVEMETERGAFLDNSLRYQASLQFLGSRLRTLTTALKGE